MGAEFDPTPAGEVSVVTPEPPRRTKRQYMGRFDESKMALETSRSPQRVELELELFPALVRPGYFARHIESVELRTTPQRATLKLLHASLVDAGETLQDGTPVLRPADALCWLLEQIAVRLSSETIDRIMEAVQS